MCRLAVAAGRKVESSDARAHNDSPAMRQGIDGIENQVGQCFAQFAFDTDQTRQKLVQVGLHFDSDAATLRDIPPAWPRHVDDLLGQMIEIDCKKRLMLVTTSIEFPKTSHDMGDIFPSSLD